VSFLPVDHISDSLESIFWVKILTFFDADPDPGSGIFFEPGSGMGKNRIRNTGTKYLYGTGTALLFFHIFRKASLLERMLMETSISRIMLTSTEEIGRNSYILKCL
jgi:hypothetical protein